MSDMEQFKQTYIAECFELLADMEERLMALDPHASDAEQLNAIFRCAHSIKGGSGAFGLSYITNFTHVLEALLDAMREGKVQASRDVVDALLKSVDIVSQMVHAASINEQPPADLGSQLLVILRKAANLEVQQSVLVAKPLEVDAQQPTRYLIDFAPHENLFCTGNEPLLLLRELKQLGALDVTPYIQRVPHLQELNPSHCYLGWTLCLQTQSTESAIREVFEFVEDCCDLKITVMPEPQTQEAQAEISARNVKLVAANTEEASAKQGGATSSIRVDLEKIDRLVNMVGEMVITEAMLRSQTRGIALEQNVELFRGMDELSQHTRELQEAVMAVRMQPVKSIFSRMPRIVRDLSAQLGKDVKLVMSGENTEVDKTVIEQLGDPLTHMIRNSVDHGIEKPEARVKTGKPAQGTIQLMSYHRGGRILIEIRDDGAGINRERVLKKAREKGLVAQDAQLSDEECDNLIFLPGFSTAEVVSNVSGRGVGMDVVKRNIESLNGTVKVNTDPGNGAVFTVSLPLTLAILDGMIVRVGAEHYIIPITSIIESLRPKAEEFRHVEGHSDVINVRGDFISIIYLSRIFNITDAVTQAGKALVVLVESGNERMGLVVDELIGQQQVVIKSLEANTDPVKGISGATILGDGRVSLILEINDLASLCKDAASENSSKLKAA